MLTEAQRRELIDFLAQRNIDPLLYGGERLIDLHLRWILLLDHLSGRTFLGGTR